MCAPMWPSAMSELVDGPKTNQIGMFCFMLCRALQVELVIVENRSIPLQIWELNSSSEPHGSPARRKISLSIHHPYIASMA